MPPGRTVMGSVSYSTTPSPIPSVTCVTALQVSGCRKLILHRLPLPSAWCLPWKAALRVMALWAEWLAFLMCGKLKQKTAMSQPVLFPKTNSTLEKPVNIKTKSLIVSRKKHSN